MSLWRRFALAAAVSAACGVGAAADTALPPLQIDSGLIAGTTRDGVNRFFGIPYVAPPVGELRFKAPEPVKPWTGVKAADAFGPVCRQTADWMKEPQSEDCLRLNVWAPAKPGKYPVMVWIHGGAYSSGSGTQMGPDAGNALVAHDVILVTINYRLGQFGFFPHPALRAESGGKVSGNQGALDQIAALKWIQKNIAVFGGDASRVTIFGESAGGGAVALLTMSPEAKGLFHRAIAESGTTDKLRPLADAEKAGIAFANGDGAAQLAALRKLSDDELLKMKWRPEPNKDGAALPYDMGEGYANGTHNRVPMMTGWNADEGLDLAPGFFGGAKQFTVGHYTAAMKQIFNGQIPPPVAQAYPANTDAEANASLYRLATDMMGYSAYKWGDQQLKSKTEPGYLYFFVHSPAEPLTPCTYGCKAGHTAEIKFAFNTLALDPRPWTAEDKRIAEQMIGYWTNFAKTGDPNGPSLPKWGSFDGAPPSVLVIGSKDEIKARGAFPDFRPFLAMGL